MPSGLHPELEDALQIDVRPARSDRRRRDRSGRSDRARPGRGRGLLSRDDAEADGRRSASRRGVRRCWRWSRRCTRARAPPARAWCRFSAASAIPGAEVHATQLTRRLGEPGRRHGDAAAGAGRRGIGRRQARDAQGPLRPGGDGAVQVGHARARRHRRRGAVEAAGRERQRLLAAGAEVAERARRRRRHLPAVLRRRRRAGRRRRSTIA